MSNPSPRHASSVSVFMYLTPTLARIARHVSVANETSARQEFSQRCLSHRFSPFSWQHPDILKIIVAASVASFLSSQQSSRNVRRCLLCGVASNTALVSSPRFCQSMQPCTAQFKIPATLSELLRQACLSLVPHIGGASCGLNAP